MTIRVSEVLLGKAVSKWSWQVCCGSVNHCINGAGRMHQNDRDGRRKFENYPPLETNPGVVRAILEPHINRNI